MVIESTPKNVKEETNVPWLFIIVVLVVFAELAFPHVIARYELSKVEDKIMVPTSEDIP